jgi:Phage integrase, N-terminal SAM-like domain
MRGLVRCANYCGVWTKPLARRTLTREARPIGRVAYGSQGCLVTHLKRAMLEELQRRNYATTTVYDYLKAVERFAKYFHTSPDQLNQSHLRRYQAYLLRERKLTAMRPRLETDCISTLKATESSQCHLRRS